MRFEYDDLELLRQNHPAWRLLRADHAALAAGFLHRAFVAPNVRSIGQADLVERLEDELFALRARLGESAFPKPARTYLDDWAAPDKGWLRKFYGAGSDEPQFDLTPATEKALVWLGTLEERSFVGTESRLLTLFELLRQISAGTQTDPQSRLDELHRRRAEIDAEIAQVIAGDPPLRRKKDINGPRKRVTSRARRSSQGMSWLAACMSRSPRIAGNIAWPPARYSTVTDLARFLGLSTSVPRASAVW